MLYISQFVMMYKEKHPYSFVYPLFFEVYLLTIKLLGESFNCSAALLPCGSFL
ncbi:hypothetical protein TRIP_D230006 [uncultured Paludibacter sp.]|uniref:Uncharacterized protein n=1 Tax=uncultured Paludibacter sp. TaxID=497635 RepID=A0A653A7L0_9BACT|nr:hypothetical protein TRIP_D230006 [uncultured Paludibacter sp.]